MAKLFNKKKKSQTVVPKEAVVSQKTNTLVLAKTPSRTSVFFRDKEIICHRDKKPFAEIVICEKYSGKKEKLIQKTLPLICEKAEKNSQGIEMLFSAKGHTVRLDIKEEEKQLHIKIKKESGLTAKLYFPRGTKENTSSFFSQKKQKTKEKPIFYTKTPNFASTDGFFYNLKTAKGWEAEITDRDIVYKIFGEKAKVFVIKTESSEENINYYFSQDAIPQKHILEKGVYFTTDAEKAVEKIERLEKGLISFTGVVFSFDAARLDEFSALSRQIKRLGKEIVLKLKPYLPIKKVSEINRAYLVWDKAGDLLVEEIGGQKHYAINLACKEARRWIQNQIRNYLDLGAKGIIAECGRIDEEKALLPDEENFSYVETWYILWQRLVKEVVDEYPNRFLLLRHNGAKSPKYGALLTDEARWSDIEKDGIKKEMQSLTQNGMGEDILTELGGVDNDDEKVYDNAEKWFFLCRKMPMIIFGRIPEKVIKRYYYLLEQKKA